MKSPAFQVDVSNLLPERQSILSDLNQISCKVRIFWIEIYFILLLQAKHNRGVEIVRAWHGTSYKIARSIMVNGFASLAILDEGWFGKGIYFTTHPEYLDCALTLHFSLLYYIYAMRYTSEKQDPCIILCYLILFNPYPVVFQDAVRLKCSFVGLLI